MFVFIGLLYTGVGDEKLISQNSFCARTDQNDTLTTNNSILWYHGGITFTTQSSVASRGQNIFYHLFLGTRQSCQNHLYGPRSHSSIGRARGCLYASGSCHVQSLSILQATGNAPL